MNIRTAAAPAILAAMLSLAAWPAAGGDQPAVLASFVVLGNTDGGNTVPMARVVVDGADSPCPRLVPAAGTGAERPMTPRQNPDPEHFPVQVCEALYPPAGKMRVAGHSETLPAMPATLSRVTVFGDTGCKPDSQHGCHEDSSRHWPLHKMASAEAAADPGPDLVLHVGDYNYRGTPGHIHIDGKKVPVYDAGDNTPRLDCKLSGPYVGQNSRGSDTPDSWDNWNRDFFLPAGKLLRAAPWVFARGNHELCSRAGPGWFYLLDAGSALLGGTQGQLSCPAAESGDPLVFRKPYRIDLNGLSILVLDSANACDQGNLHQAHFDAQFKEIQRLATAAPSGNALWLQSHRPIWGVKKSEEDRSGSNPGDSPKYAVIDRTLQSAFARHPLPQPVHLVLSGHMHRFQVISFPSDDRTRRPTQLIVGNGGVKLAKNHPKKPFRLEIDNMEGVGFGVSKFGYMNIELRSGGAWTGELVNRKGRTLARCDTDHPSSTGVCTPVK